MLDPELEAAIRARISNAAFWSWMGFELVSLGDGSSEIRLDLRPHHLNPGGIPHGGVIASLLDVAIGMALRTKLGTDASHVTVNLSINYVRAVRDGAIVARGCAVHSGERTGLGEAALYTESGELLARATATFLNVRGTGDLRPLDGE